MDVGALLEGLFDFQRFEKNKALQSVIDEAAARYSCRELNEDELEKLSAAGDPYLQALNGEKKDGRP